MYWRLFCGSSLYNAKYANNSNVSASIFLCNSSASASTDCCCCSCCCDRDFVTDGGDDSEDDLVVLFVVMAGWGNITLTIERSVLCVIIAYGVDCSPVDLELSSFQNLGAAYCCFCMYVVLTGLPCLDSSPLSLSSFVGRLRAVSRTSHSAVLNPTINR